MLTEFIRPQLYPKQLEAFYTPKRFSCIEASTKAGKTVGAIAWLLEQAFAGRDGQNFWWVAPVSAQADIAFRRLKANLTRGAFTSSESPWPHVTILNGAMLWFKSGDKPDSLYGEDVFAAVVDEASRCKAESWHALFSTLTATRGNARIVGNVKGRKNWFYALARQAEAGDPEMHYARITADDAVAARVLDADVIDFARRTLPENVFRELYMAEPSDDAGNPFGAAHIQACVSSMSTDVPVVWGIDIAKKQDWFVCIGLDALGRVCRFERWQGWPWRRSIEHVRAMVGEDTPALVDSTGVGDPVLEELQVERGNFIGFNFTAPSKQKIMEGLAVSIQSHEMTYPDGPIRTELENFEYVFTRTGVQYAAAEGHNDDCVCALALAREQWTALAPGENIMKFYAAQAAGMRAAAQRQLTTEAEPLRVPTSNVVPFRQPLLLRDEVVENELTELYNESLRANSVLLSPSCEGCGQAITGSSRVSDGQFVWHPQCAGAHRGLRRA